MVLLVANKEYLIFRWKYCSNPFPEAKRPSSGVVVRIGESNGGPISTDYTLDEPDPLADAPRVVEARCSALAAEDYSELLGLRPRVLEEGPVAVVKGLKPANYYSKIVHTTTLYIKMELILVS